MREKIEDWDINPIDGSTMHHGHNVVRSDDYDIQNPYREGDFLLIMDVAAWLFATYDYSRQHWMEATQEGTEDALHLTLMRMHLKL